MRIRTWMLLLAFWSTVAVAGDQSVMTVDEEVRALIGLEHGPSLMEQRITGHLSCLNYGGGILTIRGRQYDGWNTALVQCQGRWVMLLERFLGGKTFEEYRWRIVDALLLPEVVGIEIDPDRPEGPYLTVECYLDNKWGTHFYTVMRLSKRKRMDWRTGVLGAWGYDMKTKRIVPLSTKRVTCNKPEPEE